MSKEFLKYRVRCTTADSWKYWILPSTDPVPTTCPTHSNHSINVTLTSIEDTIKEEKVTIREELIETGGNFQTKSVKITSGANTTNTSSISWPYPISAMVLKFVIPSGMEGDTVGLAIGKDTIIGVLTSGTVSVSAWTSQNYNEGDIVSFSHPIFGSRYYSCIQTTTANQSPTNKSFWRHGYKLSVSSTVTTNTYVGYHIKLFNGVNDDDVGRVLGIDIENGKIYVETAPTNTFNAGTTYVRQTVYFMKDWNVGSGGAYSIGESKIGGSYIPADTIVTAIYTNNSGTEKTFVGSVEYLY